MLENEIRAVAVVSQKGSRSAQEDHVVINEQKRVFVIADGFGGPAPGALASKSACDEVGNFLVREMGDQDATLPFVLRSYFSLAGNVLFNALIHANRKLLRLNQGKGVHERGGASVLAGFMDGDLLALASAGSCTAWLIRGGQTAELVMPRTYGRLVDPFARSAAKTEHQIPLTALGLSEDLEPEIFEYRIRRGDWLLIQTDGLPDSVRLQTAEIQTQGLDGAASVAAFKKVCSAAQSDDNLSGSLIIF